MNQMLMTSYSPDDFKAMLREIVREEIGAAKGPEAWLTVQQVAERLGKSDKTIIRWIKDGIIRRVSGGDGAPYRISSLEVAELSRAANSSGDVSK